MTSGRNFDPQCLSLAEHFLRGSEVEDSIANRRSLAVAIQVAVEGWFASQDDIIGLRGSFTIQAAEPR